MAVVMVLVLGVAAALLTGRYESRGNATLRSEIAADQRADSH